MLPKLENEEKIIKNPKDFFLVLGGIHDANLNAFEWRIGDKKSTIEIDDMYSNFYQTPEYPGTSPARFIANGIRNMQMDIIESSFESIRILKLYVNKISEDNSVAAIIFGEGRIKFEFQILTGISI